MKTFLKILVMCILLATLAAFTFVPPAHQLPSQVRCTPVALHQLPPPDTLVLMFPAKKAAPGETICMPVIARGFQKILSMQYTMVWDPAVLRLTDIRNFNLRGLGENNFGTHLAGEGMLTFSWYDPNLRGESRPDGSVLYELCFEVVGAERSATGVHFSNRPTIVEISNAVGNFLALDARDGRVEIVKP